MHNSLRRAEEEALDNLRSKDSPTSTKTPTLPVSMSFPLDSYTPGAQFLNVTASTENDRLHLTGVYHASDLIPVLLFSVGVPWVEPCVRHVCCLWDVARRYQDHALLSALGPTCNQDVNLGQLDLMKGNAAGTQWSVDTMMHPSFVAMLFLSAAPAFYMYYQILPLQWIETSTVRWQSSWYGQPCHQVLYPSGQQVCIACFNTKPDNAVFVFSANWFSTFQCKWVCKPGFTGPNCEVEVNMAVYVTGTLTVALILAGMVACIIEGRRYKPPPVVEEEAPFRLKADVIQPPPPKFVVRPSAADMIVFKEAAAEIRIKLQ